MNVFKDRLVLVLIVILIMSGAIWKWYEGSEPAPVIREAINETGDTEITIETITVHLVGAVNNPGVFHLPQGSRVYNLIEAGGGFNNDADTHLINKARPLIDGEQVQVHEVGRASDAMIDYGNALININRATVSELMELPGIGEVKAKQIIAYREKSGFFTEIRQLMDVSGIGAKTFEAIEELITVY